MILITVLKFLQYIQIIYVLIIPLSQVFIFNVFFFRKLQNLFANYAENYMKKKINKP